jgi:hypothetical protein
MKISANQPTVAANHLAHAPTLPKAAHKAYVDTFAAWTQTFPTSALQQSKGPSAEALKDATKVQLLVEGSAHAVTNLVVTHEKNGNTGRYLQFEAAAGSPDEWKKIKPGFVERAIVQDFGDSLFNAQGTTSKAPVAHVDSYPSFDLTPKNFDGVVTLFNVGDTKWFLRSRFPDRPDSWANVSPPAADGAKVQRSTTSTADVKSALTSAGPLAAGKPMGALGLHGLRSGVAPLASRVFVPGESHAHAFPKGIDARISTQDESISGTDKDGTTRTFTSSSATLHLKDPTSSHEHRIGGSHTFHAAKADFLDQLKSEYAQDWDVSSSFTAAGGYGRFASVIEGGSDYMGGAHPNSGSSLATYDVVTGKPVQLKDILSKDELKVVQDSIAHALASHGVNLGGSRQAASDLFSGANDQANTSFALREEKGRVLLSINLTTGIHALAARESNFSFDVSSSETLRKHAAL